MNHMNINKALMWLALWVSASAAAEHPLYVVLLQDEPLALRVVGDLKSAQARAVRAELQAQQDGVLAQLATRDKSAPTPLHRYQSALNGFSVRLSETQAEQLRDLAAVRSVQIDTLQPVHTDAGPAWVGAPDAWSGAVNGTALRGEGVVIGVIDTGIYPQHPAFAGQAADGYQHVNPRGQLFGLCTEQLCNDKLIGVYDFSNEGSGGLDTTGHGTHVASTAAGNPLNAVFNGLPYAVSGVAPRASLISYKACFASEENPSGLCSRASLLASIDQATEDGVDVVNYSIGSDLPCSPWTGQDSLDHCGPLSFGEEALAMLNAYHAGVLFVLSAGNNGPAASTVGYPAVAPWVLAVANSTHNRRTAGYLRAASGGAEALPDQAGTTLTGGIGPRRVVHARDFGNALCGVGEPNFVLDCADSIPINAPNSSNPFAPGTFNGEIVVCDRGLYGRVEKGFNVAQAGAGGFVLANAADQQESIVADVHCLPGLHLGFQAGEQVRDWLAQGSDHSAQLSGQQVEYLTEAADILNASSSKGPARIVLPSATALQNPPTVAMDYLKPNLAAPGTSILAADYLSNGLASKTGTSMAAPHTAGAAALLLQAHPHFTTGHAISALQTGALMHTLRREDGVTLSRFNDSGAGRLQVPDALRAGLFVIEDRAGFVAADPALGGETAQLNLPALVHSDCHPGCEFTRRLISDYPDVSWRAEVLSDDGLVLTVTPNVVQAGPNQPASLQVEVDTRNSQRIGQWADARIVFTPEGGPINNPPPDFVPPAPMQLPLSVHIPAGTYPSTQVISGNNRYGAVDLELNGINEIPTAHITGYGPLNPERSLLVIDANPAGSGVFDLLGESLTLVDVPADTLMLWIETVRVTQGTTAKLYVGRDDNGDALPDEDEVLCQQVSNFGAEKTCQLQQPQPGRHWIVVHNFNSPGNQSATFGLHVTQFNASHAAQPAQLSASAVPALAEAGWMLTGDNPGVLADQTTLRLYHQLPLMPPNPVPDWPLNERRHYALLGIGANADAPAGVALVPFRFDSDAALLNARVEHLNGRVVELQSVDGVQAQPVYLDVGFAAESVQLDVQGVSDYTVQLHRSDLAAVQALELLPDVTGQTPDATLSSDQAQLIHANHRRHVLDVNGLAPGRWVVVLHSGINQHSPQQPGYVKLSAAVNYRTDALVQPSGSLWFNPERSGWGFDFSRVGEAHAFTWYHFDHLGRPSWQQAAGFDAPANQWNGELRRFSWLNGTPRSQWRGEVSVVFLDATHAVVNLFTAEGNHSEPVQAIRAPNSACGQENGQTRRVTGLWYVPAEAGYGSTVLSNATTEVHVLYYYDQYGQPVWAIGDRAWTDSGAELTMRQAHNGFCQGCAATPLEFTPIGQIQRTYQNDAQATYAIDTELVPPLSGLWHSQGAAEKISVAVDCQ